MTKEQLQIHKQRLDKCREYRDRLTPWEHNFVEDIIEQVNERAWLSEKQAEILERIYSERTGI